MATRIAIRDGYEFASTRTGRTYHVARVGAIVEREFAMDSTGTMECGRNLRGVVGNRFIRDVTERVGKRRIVCEDCFNRTLLYGIRATVVQD